jgi:AcrR family transcriptional regulator
MAIKQNPEELRLSALAEARALMIEGGPDQVKARILASRLGVSVGSVYNLFGDLDELIFHVGAGVYDELIAAIDAATSTLTDADAPGRMMVLAKAYLDFVHAHQPLWASVLAFNRRGKSRVPAWYRAKERDLFQLARHAMTGFERDISEEERDLAARALWAAIHGIVTISVGRDGMVATRQDVHNQIELIISSVAENFARRAEAQSKAATVPEPSRSAK